MILVDANVLMYAAGAEHPNKLPSAAFLRRVARDEVESAIDAEVLQEILHRYRAINRWERGKRVYDAARHLFPIVIPINETILDISRRLMDTYRTLQARDALHAAVVIHHGMEAICSYDRDFDQIKEIRRLDPSDFGIRKTKPPAAVCILAEGIVDYAGLFPPAQLDMPGAVAEYALARRTDDAWMLGRFIVPVGRLAEFEGAARGHLPQSGDPWPLSVLAGGDPADDRARIDAFNAAHAGGAVIEAVELKAATAEDVRRQTGIFSGLETYFEIPHSNDPSALMTALAEHGVRAKIRTGGVTADAIPSSVEVARFLRAAAAAGVAFKATAGLHHPLRGEYRLTYAADSPAATMHGYLNVFLAAALVRRESVGEPEIVALLEERDAAAFAVDGDGVRWRGHAMSAEDLAAARRDFAASYGSCSFREPVDELRDLRFPRAPLDQRSRRRVNA